MKGCLLAVASFLVLSSGTALADRVSWKFLESVGGLAVGQPLRESKGWVLPVRADLSGLTQTTVPPATLNSGIACLETQASREASTIVLSIVSGVAGEGRKAQCPAAKLGELAPGLYSVVYRGVGEADVSVGKFVIETTEPSGAVGGCPSAPSPWTVTKRPGPDFDVCYYEAKGLAGFFGIYLGLHPMFHPPAGAKGIAGSVGGRPVEWFAKEPSSDAPKFAQQALVLPPSDQSTGLIAHVWIYGSTARELEDVRKAVAQLKW